MTLVDAAVKAHEEAERQRYQDRLDKEDEATEAACKGAARWAAQKLGDGPETEWLRTVTSWEQVEVIWDDASNTCTVKVRAVDTDGLDFQYWRERKPNSVHDHFSVLRKRDKPFQSATLRYEREYEYVDIANLAHLGQLITEGRLAAWLPSGEETTIGEVRRRRAWAADPNVQWEPIHGTGEPDQQASLYGPYDAQVGPQDPNRGTWSWTLLDRGFDGDQEIASGDVDTEAEAKAAVVQHLINNYLEGTA